MRLQSLLRPVTGVEVGVFHQLSALVSEGSRMV